MKFEDNALNRRAAKAAAETFVRLNPSYQKSPANHAAICQKIYQLDLDPREVSAYETAWSEVTRERVPEITITYESRGEIFRGLEALEQMPASEYRRHLEEDLRFRETAEALLGNAI